MLREILPADVEVCETARPSPVAVLFPEEQACVGRCAPKRLEEFAAGRACARVVLGHFGYTRFPLLCGPRREPLWPPDITGSISHCEGYCAAAAAKKTAVETIGVDVESNQPLPEGVLRLVARDEEITMLSQLPGDGVRWDRLLFSAKESLFKAWFPIERQWLGFEEARVELVPGSGMMTMKVLRSASSEAFRSVVAGRFTFTRQHISTAVVLVRG